jgi:hypothetical protein
MAPILPSELTGHMGNQAPNGRAKRVQRLSGIVLVAVAALIYAATLDTGFEPRELEGGDLITHQYAQVQARPSNAPGYPLYTMGGWLWFHGIRGLAQLTTAKAINPIPILSSYSTLWALLSVWLLYAIVCRLTRTPTQPAGNWSLAWLLAAFYGVTYFFWYYATTTEQYSSAIAQTLAVLYVYLLWRDGAAVRPKPTAKHSLEPAIDARHEPPTLGLLFLLAFLCGISLAHMLTVAFIVPPLVLVILWQRPDLLRNGRAILGSVLAAFLPLLSYSFVYVRGAAHPEWWGEGDWPNARAWFISFLSTAQGREELGWGFEPGAAFFGNGFPELIWHELSLPLLLLGLLGILLFDRKLATLLYGTIVITVTFSWAYRYGNWYQVILPVYPLILLGNAAIAQAWTRHWTSVERSQQAEGARSLLRAAPLILLAAATIWRAAASIPAADSRNRSEDSAFDRSAILLDQALPAGVPLYATVDDALALQYLVEIWEYGGSHPVISSPQAAQHLAQGKSVLATVAATSILLEELPQDLALEASLFSPDWVGIEPSEGKNRLFEKALPMTALENDSGGADGITIVDGVALEGYAVSSGPDGYPVLSDQPATLDLTLVWQLQAPGWPADLAISVRPTAAGEFLPNPTGETGAIIQVDSNEPVIGLFDAQALGEESNIVDAYRLSFPPAADGLVLIVYRRSNTGFENLAEIPLRVD